MRLADCRLPIVSPLANHVAILHLNKEKNQSAL